MERARRRFLELQQRGITANINEIENDIIERDNRDMNREFAPLKQADDAILVDSSDMTIEEVAEYIIKCYEQIR
jgi:cytidylate kinase